MTDSLQYAFIQDACHLERIIARDYKEIFSWAEYLIRKNLKLEQGQPMPTNWKNDIPFLLKGFTKEKFFDKMDRIKELQLILRQFYTVYRKYDHQNKILQQQNEELQKCLDGNMETINLFGIMLQNQLKQNNSTSITQ